MMTQPKGTVRDWMTSDPITITSDASLLHAYEVMHSRRIRRLPVVDASGQLFGMLTHSDIQQVLPFTRSVTDHADIVFGLAGQTVAEIMTPNPYTVGPDDPIGHVAKQMISRKISGLPVVTDGRVVGIITESDIFRLVVESWPEEPE
jgi:acetoin utilization protein AcuB